MQVHITMKSANAKTGPIPVSTTERASCPPDCAMRAELCDPSTLGHWAHYFDHLTGAAGCHWETAGRNVNAELGRVVY